MSLTYDELLEAVTDDVKSWIARVHANDGEVGEIDIRAYLKKHWPRAPDAAKDAVVKTMMTK